ncbi:MAG: radical SAM protein, partial [Planctomycetota bacterium]
VAALVTRLAAAGVNQVVSSTFKLRRDSAARFAERFPEAAAAAEPLYQAERIAGYRYLAEPERRRRMEMVKALAEEAGLGFSCCREGMPELNAESCDGQHLLAEPDAA